MGVFIITSLFAGSLIGVGWLDERMGPLGILGLGIFLKSQYAQLRLLPTLIGGCLTGLASYGIATSWLLFTIEYLADCGRPAACFIFGFVLFFLSLKYVAFALSWWLARRIVPTTAWLIAPAIVAGIDQWFTCPFPSPTAVLLSGYLPAVQLAELGGVNLVSMYVVALAGGLAVGITKLQSELNRLRKLPQLILTSGAGCACDVDQAGRQTLTGLRWRSIVLAFGLATLPLCWGSVRLAQWEPKSLAEGRDLSALRIGLVQTDTQFYLSHAQLIDASRAMAQKVDLIVWPECSLGDYSSELLDYSDPKRVHELASGDDTRYQPFPNPIAPLLAGGDIWDPDPTTGLPTTRYVSAMLLDRNEILVGRHDKNNLMAFGEWIPLERQLPWIRKILGPSQVISASTRNEPIGEIDGVVLGALLCCEDMMPATVREQVARGSDLLITLGNGTCFNSPVALDQHFRIARFRVIENRVPLVRCCSKGVTCQLAPSGRVVARLPNSNDASLIVTVSIADHRPTIYSRWGDLVTQLICGVSIAIAIGLHGTRALRRPKSINSKSRA